MGGPCDVLFLCSGNYYRSRFAEEVFNHHSRKNAIGHRAFSAGLKVAGTRHVNPGPISIHTVRAMERHGVPVPDAWRDPVPATRAMIGAAGLTVALCRREHEPLISAQFPESLPGIVFWEVEDIGAETPERATRHIHDQTLALLGRMTQRTRP